MVGLFLLPDQSLRCHAANALRRGVWAHLFSQFPRTRGLPEPLRSISDVWTGFSGSNVLRVGISYRQKEPANVRNSNL